jgi:hypothetical protein
MQNSTNGMSIRRWSVRAFVLASLLLVVSFGIVSSYKTHVRGAAQNVIESAENIRSITDAQRHLKTWRQLSTFRETNSPDGRGRAYQVEVTNYWLSRLKLAPSAGLLGEIVVYDDELKAVVLGMYTGPDGHSVWVQEEFSPEASDGMVVNANRDNAGRPWRAIATFPAKLPQPEREKAFRFDANCLVKLGGCKDAEEIHPDIWQSKIASAARGK